MDLIGRLAQQIDLNADGSMAPDTPPPAPDMPAAFADGPETATAAQPTAPAESMDQSSAGKIVNLDLDGLADKGFLTPQNDRSLLAEEYRVIKRPLLREAFHPRRSSDDRQHMVLVTSSKPGEGKTFTAINLGMSIASEHDVQVLVIDSDIRRMGLSYTLGLNNYKGLMDVLQDAELSLSDVILRTNVPHLSILPGGQAMGAATEILASQKMKAVIDDITRRYANRFIIIDSPPILASSEPGVLASYVGKVVMVVQANATTKGAIAQSLSLIDVCPNVNFVLNNVTATAGPERFGYYGSYDYD
jgi:exopolysaccharide/PEP-CTERM locus tyrosine autokinase